MAKKMNTKTMAMYGVAAAVLGVAGFFGYKFWKNKQGTMAGVDYTPMNGVSYTPLNGVDFTPMNGVDFTPMQGVDFTPMGGFDDSLGFEEGAADFGAMADDMGDNPFERYY